MRAVQTLSLLLWVLIVGCSGTQESRALSTSERPRTTLLVRNQSPTDYVLYVVDGTHRIRLGMVTGMGEHSFVIPPHLVINQGTLNFQIDPIGSNQVGTTDEALTVREGDELTLTIR
jgi:hypothetical protein